MNHTSAAQILGVKNNADEDEIKKAYRRGCLKWHPDRHAQKTDDEVKYAEQKFKEVSEAYQTLTSPPQQPEMSGGFQPFFSSRGGGAHWRSAADFEGFQDPIDIFRQVFGNHGHVFDVGVDLGHSSGHHPRSRGGGVPWDFDDVDNNHPQFLFPQPMGMGMARMHNHQSLFGAGSGFFYCDLRDLPPSGGRGGGGSGMREEVMVTEVRNGKAVTRKVVTVDGQVVSNEVVKGHKNKKKNKGKSLG